MMVPCVCGHTFPLAANLTRMARILLLRVAFACCPTCGREGAWRVSHDLWVQLSLVSALSLARVDEVVADFAAGLEAVETPADLWGGR
jgi:hypothetical protein